MVGYVVVGVVVGGVNVSCGCGKKRRRKEKRKIGKKTTTERMT